MPSGVVPCYLVCYSLQYIKELSTIEDVQYEVESFRRFEESWVGKTAAVNRATTMREIFEALKAVNLTDTVAEPYIRTRANVKAGFYHTNPEQISVWAACFD